MDNVRPLRARRPPRPSPRRRLRTIVIGIVVAVVVLGAALIGRIFGLYVDWLWFGEVGLRQVFWTGIWTRLALGAIAAGVFFVVVAGNILLARRLAPDFRSSSIEGVVEPRSDVLRKYLGRVGLGVAAVVAVIAGFGASGAWLVFLRALNASSFGVDDPVFGRDLGFYIFTMPAWHAVQNFALAALIVSLVAAAIVHLVLGGVDYTPAPAPPTGEGAPFRGPTSPGQAAQYVRSQVQVHLPGAAVAHLSALLAAIFVVVGIGQLFRAWGLLYSNAGAVFGAGYTDVHIRLPLTRVTMVLAFVLAAALVYNIWRRHRWWPVVIGVWIVALIVLRGIVPAAYQSLIVNPNQLDKEQQYIRHNIDATKAAYDLDKVDSQPLAMTTEIVPAVLADNQPTLSNIRLWDPDTLTRSYRQLQQLRPYYSFVDADVDRYTVHGEYTQTMLSARELDISGLPSQAQTWVNQHITYTHGFGAVVSAVNQVTADGSPDFLVQDVPPRSVQGLEITQPRIYYGEIGTDYTLVKTKDREFDYPGAGGADVYRNYTGSGGVPIGSFLPKLAFAWRFGTIKFFTSSAIDGDSRVIIRNNVMQRVEAAAPFLTYDPDPYMVISDGRLYWVADAYTSSGNYPYSTPEAGLNYIRNSVKVVIDAYNGSMKFFAFDEQDPILQTYEKIYPDLFTPAGEMPQALKDHIRYPEGLFNVQSEVYATYHVDDPAVLYNKGDQWQIPDNVALSGPGRMAAYYVIMRLPGSAQEEFLLMIPFVPNTRPNMVAWLAALSDGQDYGKAVAFQFGKGASVYGPSQVEAAINQDPQISAQRSLWGQQGSRVIMGNLLVIPIEDSLLYVQPLYLESEQTQLPQNKRVIVFYQMSASAEGSPGRQVVVMQPTLQEALVDAFGNAPDVGPVTGGTGGGTGGGAGGGTGGGTGGTGQGGTATGNVSARAQRLIEQANSQFEAAQAAQQSGDWAEYGRQIEALQQTLSQLQQLQ